MTNASGDWGWGGHTCRAQSVQGQWRADDFCEHINVKELRAAYNTLYQLMEIGDHVDLQMDSTTAVAYTNKMGGTVSPALTREVASLRNLVVTQQGWLKASWVPQDLNKEADLLSKEYVEKWDFTLPPHCESLLWQRFRWPNVDLFASSKYHVASWYF